VISRCRVHNLGVRGRWRRERDLERERDEGVGEREKEVGCYRRDPAPEYHLAEFERWVVLWLEELAVDGEVEGEGEEGYDDEVDEANCYCGCSGWREEGA